MKLSDYFTNILSAIFTPNNANIDKKREELYTIYTSIIKNNDDIIKTQDERALLQDDVIKAQEKMLKDFNISYNTLFKKYNSVISENHRLNEINTVLNNKLQRYYKTGKKVKEKVNFLINYIYKICN